MECKKNIFILFFASIFSFCVAEVFVRLFIPEAPAYNRRVLLWSIPHLVLDQSGAVRYAASQNLREAALYDGVAEYDVKFRVNNWGLIDHRDYAVEDAGSYSYAFVGDSFTAGAHGGDPWVPVLRDRIQVTNPEIEILNLGVSATGLIHFDKLIRSISKQKRIDNIVIIAISGDFFRQFWRPLSSSDGTRLCPDEVEDLSCLNFLPIASAIDFDATEKELLLVGEEHIRVANARLRDIYLFRILRHSRFLKFVVDRFRSWNKIAPQTTHYLQPYQLTILKNLRRDFPDSDIYIIHLPQKHELQLGSGYDVKINPSMMKELGIKYFPALSECQWDLNMFHKKDSHPNAIGYENISHCISEYLF